MQIETPFRQGRRSGVFLTVKRVLAVLMWALYLLSGGFIKDKLRAPGSGSCAEKKLEVGPAGERA